MNLKSWLIIVILLFAIGIAWGVFSPSDTGGAFSGETRALQQLADLISGLPVGLMLGFILLKNVSAVLFSFVLSPLFLLVPIFSLVANGWLIGSVANAVASQRSIGYFLTGVLPHGIFELPALFIGEAAAIGLGVAAIRAVFNRSWRANLSGALKNNLRYLGISVALFVPAAVIETFVTPLLLRRFG